MKRSHVTGKLHAELRRIGALVPEYSGRREAIGGLMKSGETPALRAAHRETSGHLDRLLKRKARVSTVLDKLLKRS